MLFASFVASLSFWSYGLRNRYLISHISQVDRPSKGFSQGFVPSDREKTCFPYFKLYCLQAAIDSFAVLSPGKIYHGRALKSCCCISYPLPSHLPSTVVKSLSASYFCMCLLNVEIIQGIKEMFWIYSQPGSCWSSQKKNPKGVMRFWLTKTWQLHFRAHRWN